jgi:hypothetical protein
MSAYARLGSWKAHRPAMGPDRMASSTSLAKGTDT